MLDYLSPGGNGGGMSDMMTSAMPTGIPGSPPPSSTGNFVPVGGSPPMPPSPAPGVIAPSGPITQSMMPPPAPPNPADIQYKTVTQADGSGLIHMLNPDGSVGPAVTIIPATKLFKAPKQAGTK